MLAATVVGPESWRNASAAVTSRLRCWPTPARRGSIRNADRTTRPLSGAHFNPAVSVIEALRGRLAWGDASLTRSCKSAAAV